MSSKVLYLVIPCYNEEEIIEDTGNKLNKYITELISLKKINSKSKICFIDDGSKDNTWNLISNICKENNIFIGIKLSHNQGHQNALLAGMLEVRNYCDMVISMDADLQDDFFSIDKMIDKYNQGYEVVYGVRKNRMSDTWFKKNTALLYYKLLQYMTNDGIVYNHADFRLLSKKVLEALDKYKEVNLFLRGIIPMIGYPSSIVYYDRKERLAGKSKYPLKKMISFAWQGITSLTVEPIHLIAKTGVFILVISLIILMWSFFRFINGDTVSGWTSIVFSIWGIGGLILFSIGVIGEYIGKIYLETKSRPRYIIEKILRHDNK